jgi:hypothetical protein
MPKQTGKGNRKSRQSAPERKATKHQQIPIQIPHSVDEGKRLIRELPEALRKKARERLEKLPEPAQQAIQVAEAAAQVLLLPVRLGVRLVQEVLRVPLAMLRVLRET